MSPLSHDVLLLAIGIAFGLAIPFLIAWAERPSRNRPFDQEVD